MLPLFSVPFLTQCPRRLNYKGCISVFFLFQLPVKYTQRKALIEDPQTKERNRRVKSVYKYMTPFMQDSSNGVCPPLKIKSPVMWAFQPTLSFVVASPGLPPYVFCGC